MLKRAILLTAIACVNFAVPALGETDSALAQRVRAAPDAATFNCVGLKDNDILTVSEQLKAVVLANQQFPNNPQVHINGVQSGSGTAAKVVFGKDKIAWSQNETIGRAQGNFDRSKLVLTLTLPIYSEVFVCTKATGRL